MLASIDVGSNTVRMMCGRIEQGRLLPLLYEREITRLGGGFTDQRGLSPESIERTLLALERFAAILHQQQPSALRVVGTAALRRAVNRQDFVARVGQRTGLELEVIDGQQEARLSALGVLEALQPQPEAVLVIDIGGGSTELVLLERSRIRFRESYPLGVVRLCEEVCDRQQRKLQIDAVLDRFVVDLTRSNAAELLRAANCEFVGTAGTVTTLAAIDLKMARYDWRRINNHCLSRQILADQYALLEPLEIAQREQLPGLETGRGDLILPGIEILQALLTRFSHRHIRVSDFGLLEGLLLDLHAASID
ncbi:MAG: exopolyphosphatase [Desulfuromonas sp.]|nr:MAG: exopolyphosphatase [Desulfuromonas sp.]